jgi:hypothetical protein
MSSVVISGDTSGSVTLQAPAVSGSTVLTLPATSGTVLTTASGQWITTGSNIYYNTGKVLVNTTTARANFQNSPTSPQLQLEGTDAATSIISSTRNSADTGGPRLMFGKSRGATIGSNTIVQNGDNVGQIAFEGNDGAEFVDAASISAIIDGTPGANDMPGALLFNTTADGAASPTERMRIDSSGYITNQANGNSSGLVQGSQYYRLNTASVGANATGAQSVFGVGVSLAASTQYEFEAIYGFAKTAGATSHTFSLLFGGTATLNNIGYELIFETGTNALGNNTTSSSVFLSASTAFSLATIASATSHVSAFVKGTISVNAAGTFIPQYSLSAAPGGAYSTAIGSYFKISPLAASGSNISIGSWA